MGLLGRVMLGGAAERILHSAELPIVIAPRGFHEGRATKVAHVSVAFGRADHDTRLVARAGLDGTALPGAAEGGLLRSPADGGAGRRSRGESRAAGGGGVMQRLEDDIATALASAPDTDSTGAGGSLPSSVNTALDYGSSWAEALHDVSWVDGDLLVVGISTGPLGRFFLGSHAAKIVRNSTVPVALVTRG
jgi:nucleotide-binding universal stress UspA family protein